jgi:cell division septation protein DedD
MSLLPVDDPATAIAELAAANAPWLYGVRHHSPACAVALPALLDAYQPTVIALEMPADLPAVDRVARTSRGRSAARGGGGGEDTVVTSGSIRSPDFSPELVAIRWARARGVPVVAIDLPSAERGGRDRDGRSLGIHERMRGAHEDSWEALVEGPGTLAEPERVRRAALLYGWALRLDAVRGGGVSELDLAREAYMRGAIATLLGDPAYAAWDGSPETAPDEENADDPDVVEPEDSEDSDNADDEAPKPADAKPATKPPAAKKPAATSPARKPAATPAAKQTSKKTVKKKTPGKVARAGSRVEPGDRWPGSRVRTNAGSNEVGTNQRSYESGRETWDEPPGAHAHAGLRVRLARAPAKPAAKTKPAAKPTPPSGPTRSQPGAKPASPSSKRTRGPRVAAIVGSFHAAALLPKPTLWKRPAPIKSERVELVSSLIPYGFELLDERSGYPAGIRDPLWQQRLFETQRDQGDVQGLVASCLVEITRGIRQRGLPASVPDARAAQEIAISLAMLRGLATPGRRELVEAVQTALTHGELMGRGRIVAKAMQHVMVGRTRGHLAPETPRSGLAPHVLALLDELRLPRGAKLAMVEPEDLRLDPLRSTLDRRRHVALARMTACGIPYGTLAEGVGIGGVESLTSTWRVMFTPSTEAVIELAGLRGVTLEQAATGALRAEHARRIADDKLTAAALVELTEAAAEAGAGALVREGLVELCGPRLAEATLTELIALVALLDRIVAGHIVGLPADAEDAVAGEIDAFVAPPIDRALVISTAVASILGLAGSESLVDVRSLADLTRVLERPEHHGLGDSRLRWSIDQLVETGTPMIAGAASVVQVLIATRTPEELSTTIGAWLDGAVDLETRRILAARLKGALSIAGPLFEAAPVFLAGLCERVEQMIDGDFLPRVAALRDGFETLSTSARRRLLLALGDRLGEADARGQGLDVAVSIPAELLAAAAAADAAGRAAADRVLRPSLVAAPPGAPVRAPSAIPDHAITVRDRWRMILGHERDKMNPRARRAARALDELYGTGHGEGSRSELGSGGGQEDGYPTVRAWRDEIEALFGHSVFEEVAAQAATQGRVGALLELDPESVTPSVELLEQVLSLKGGLGEAQLGRLRQLIARVVEQLVRELAVRVRPALHGAISQRTTRRPTGMLHLAKTVAANLARTRIDDGRVTFIPERLYFKSRSRRHMDWHVVLVVDVSGSMEPSVIYSAMMAAILSGVPWIGVKFIAFSTEIVDLSEHAHDPLALLLEVSVGGGTHIAKGLRYARSLVTVPQRTIVITVSDFEEGFSVDGLLGEVRALVEAGVTCLGLAALDDRGAPRYAVPIAEQVAAAGMPVAALTPMELARWIGAQIR